MVALRGRPNRLGEKSFIAALAALLAVTLVVPDAGAGRRRNGHKPPYKLGPQGGDEFNHIEMDRQEGRITIVRSYPEPGAFGCPDSKAAWATFVVRHRVRKRRPRAVAVHYDEAEMDGYTWITVTVRRRKKSIGYRSVQGPMAAGSGKLVAKLMRRPRKGQRLRIQFGLQVSSNCPQGEASSVRLPLVWVRAHRRGR